MALLVVIRGFFSTSTLGAKFKFFLAPTQKIILLPEDITVEENSGRNEFYYSIFDYNNDALTVEISAADHGTTDIGNDGTFSYSPDADYIGLDNFTITITLCHCRTN